MKLSNIVQVALVGGALDVVALSASASASASSAASVAGTTVVTSGASSSAAASSASVSMASSVASMASTTSAPASETTTWTSVPTGTAVPGNYSGMYRPQVHFSPPRGFMNDPNGMHKDANGTWHLYYQYNPTAVVAGNQHWGHATSPDLYHWTNQPIAIFPPNSTTGIFSGSAVIDTNNTSGFFPNQTNGVVAIYTLNTPTLQVQEIAYSTDGGYTFTPYAGNPVIDIGSNQFRDPKVVWYEGQWVMVVSEATKYNITIWTSPNLKNWTYVSNVNHVGILGSQYECPNMVTVPIQNGSVDYMWMLAISINPGAPLGGSITQYFAGDFNGTDFAPDYGATKFTDWGKDNYAGQWFYGLGTNDSVSIGWASNWQYTNIVPTADEGWRSSMSLPRNNYFVNSSAYGYQLVSEPYDMTPILNSSLYSNSSFVNGTEMIDFSNVTSGAVYFSMNVTIPGNATVGDDSVMNFTVSSSGGQTLSGGYFFGGNIGNTGWLDRGGCTGFEYPAFTDKFTVAPAYSIMRIEGVWDRSLFEMFINGGEYAGTFDVYPTEMLTMLEVSTGGIPDGSDISLDVWGLSSVWGQ